ncbi:hypothetical protein NP493_74g04015 [Ridgeia piscesae]|uniref:Uncharacterized protein n=1 Tax=Ridgeia piscesae TaxID=27915 RepID=A0AAD9UII3_RIDPI|nr:hypothetical protein NP493_74g04015 [Ridgeia piscesae]
MNLEEFLKELRCIDDIGDAAAQNNDRSEACIRFCEVSVAMFATDIVCLRADVDAPKIRCHTKWRGLGLGHAVCHVSTSARCFKNFCGAIHVFLRVLYRCR